MLMEESDIDEDLSDLEPEEREAQLPEPRSSSSSSEFSDSEEEDERGEGSLTAPSGQKWTTQPPNPQGRVRASNILRQRPGVTSYAAQRINENIISSFKILFDHSMLETILIETNRQGRRMKGPAWKDMDYIELDAYIGLCILRGVYKSSNESVRELWKKETGRKIFGDTMTINRFEDIRAMLRFDNPLTRSARQQRDKLAAVRLLLDSFVTNSQLCYIHNECVTVDEQLYPFKGRCSLVQYMPSKPSKYGLKFWILADSFSYYISNVELYTGKDDSRTTALGEHVVMKMATHLYGSGRNITCDNFFTSLQLSRRLETKQLSMVGTIRSHRREVPLLMRGYRGRDLYSSIFAYTIEDSVQLVSYKAKASKTVLLLSSQHKKPDASLDQKKKPEAILFYNSTKGGVDSVDERISTYSVKYRSKRWHVTVFCNVLDMACYNAFVLHTSVFPAYNANKSHRRRCFLTDLGMALTEPYRERRSAAHRPMTTAPPAGDEQPKKGRCHLCPRSSDRKSRIVCISCNKNICSSHSITKCSRCA